MARPYRQPVDERDVFRALAHPIRRKMINAALDRTRSFDEMSQLARRRPATVAMHLRVLRDARVLTATRRGKAVTYRVNRRTLKSGAQWLWAAAHSSDATPS